MAPPRSEQLLPRQFESCHVPRCWGRRATYADEHRNGGAVRARARQPADRGHAPRAHRAHSGMAAAHPTRVMLEIELNPGAQTGILSSGGWDCVSAACPPPIRAASPAPPRGPPLRVGRYGLGTQNPSGLCCPIHNKAYSPCAPMPIFQLDAIGSCTYRRRGHAPRPGSSGHPKTMGSN